MSIFAKHVRAAAASRMPVSLSSELSEDLEGNDEIVPVEDTTSDEPVVTDEPSATDPLENVPVEEPESLEEQRAALNARHDMIRNRMVAEDEPETSEEDVVDDAPVEDTPSEEEPVVPAEEAAFTDPEAPVEDVTSDEPVVTDEPEVAEGEEPVMDTEGAPVEEPEVPSEEETPETPEVSFDAEDEPETSEESSDDDDDDDDEGEEEELDESENEDLDGDVAELEAMLGDISQLNESVLAIENYGLDRGSFRIMQITGLLSGTAIESLGMESIGTHTPQEPEAEMAMEALGEKIKEKAAAFSAKIMAMAKKAGDLVTGVLNPIWEKTSSGLKKLSEKSLSAVDSATTYAKAHPFKTVMAVVAAIAAVAGVVVFATSGMPAVTAKMTAITSYAKSLVTKINGIKIPFGTIKASVVEGSAKIGLKVTSTLGAAKSQSLKALGYTDSAVKMLNGQLTRSWGAVKKATNAFGLKAVSYSKKIGEVVFDKVALPAYKAGVKGAKTLGTHMNKIETKVVNATGSNKLGGFVALTYAATVLNVVMQLVNFVVAKGLRIISAAVHAIAGKAKEA